MQIFVPELELVFVPIACNAELPLSKAIQARWPDARVVSHTFPGKRVVMWRSPHDRFEATYWMRKRSGIEENFDTWAFDTLTTGLRDVNLKPQLSYCDNPDFFLRWDFDGFRRLFHLKRLDPPDDLDGIIVWSPRTRMIFQDVYRFDLRIWGGPYAPSFGSKDQGAKSEEKTKDECGSEVCLGSSEIDSPGSEGSSDQGVGIAPDEAGRS